MPDFKIDGKPDEQASIVAKVAQLHAKQQQLLASLAADADNEPLLAQVGVVLVWSRLQCICTHGTSKGDRLAYYDYGPPHAIRQLMARGKQRRDQFVLTGQFGSRDLDLGLSGALVLSEQA